MTKLKREEAEKQEQAALHLAKQKHEIAIREKELAILKQLDQMAIRELEEDHRQRVAAAKSGEAELMDNCSLFNRHLSELNLFKDRGSIRSKKRVWYGVNSFPDGKKKDCLKWTSSSRPGSATTHPLVYDTADYNNLEQQLTTVKTMNQAAQLPSDLKSVNVNGQSHLDVVQTKT